MVSLVSDDLKEKLRYWRETGRAPGRLRRQGTSNTTEVVADDGERRGRIVGTQTEHWDDRKDANVFAPAVVVGKDSINGS